MNIFHSPQESKDLDLYERWSLTVALNLNHKTSESDHDDHDDDNNHDNDNTNNDTDDSSNDNKNNAELTYVHVTKCPSPDCQCLWLTNKPYYDEKKQNERKYSTNKHNKKKKSNKISLYKYAKSYLFYKPIPPEREEQIMNQHKYTTEHWLTVNDIDLVPTCHAIFSDNSRNGNNNNNISERRALLIRHADRNIHKDGRATTCPKCKHTFCNLCLQPWHTLNAKNGKYLFHTSITCESYNNKSMISDDRQDFMDVVHSEDARLCPSCGMRTNRVDGCNHMTCPCGYHWCWVCECRWNSSNHYGCTDANPLVIRQGGDSTSSCTIS